MNYAFYISGHSGRLIKFLEQKIFLEEIRVVISDCALDEETQKAISVNNIELKVFDRNSNGNSNKEKNRNFSDFLDATLKKKEIDYLFSLGEHILSGDLLRNYKNRIINFHPAILPMFPGLNAIDQAANSKQSILLIGNTAHFVDEGMDTGKIIMQSIIPLDAFLLDKDYNVVLDIIVEMIIKLIVIIDNNRLKMVHDRPFIEGADYNKHSLFPYVALELPTISDR